MIHIQNEIKTKSVEITFLPILIGLYMCMQKKKKEYCI